MGINIKQAFINELTRSTPEERKMMCEHAMLRWQQSYYDGDITFDEFAEAVETLRSMNFIARSEEN